MNAPEHYQPQHEGQLESIEVIRAFLGREHFISYCKGNVIKYIYRADFKGGAGDIRKAQNYLEFILEETED